MTTNICRFALILWISLMAVACFAARDLPLRPVPYLGPEEPYFLGGGIAGAGGDTHGKWDFLIGPDYTSPNFIREESITLSINGKSVPLSMELHRARESGVFFGSQWIGELEVTLVDFAVEKSSWVGRLVRCRNFSRKAVSDVVVMAEVTPANVVAHITQDNTLTMTALKGGYCFGDETKNWADRTSEIAFVEPNNCVQADGRFRLTTKSHRIQPGGIYSTGLYHLQHYDDGRSTSNYVSQILGMHPEADLQKCLRTWRGWLQIGSSALAKVTDSRAHDAVEASVIACKMEQNQDGGTIAGPRKYANSYVRDTHGAVRLFLATGHLEEAKKAIETIYHRWSVAGFIPNWWSMGSDSFIGHSFANDFSEIAAYYVLMIRGYYAKSGDRIFVDQIEKSIRYAVDGQLGLMEKNDWRISFNGDETEQYCVKEDGKEYGGFPAIPEWRSDSWSFPSAALAVASTQFYVDYLKASRKEVIARTYEAKLLKAKKAIDKCFWRSDLTPAHHHWARLKDGAFPVVTIPNYGLLPLWVDAKLNSNRQDADARAMKSERLAGSRLLPTAPPAVMGFCGHNLGYLLYDLSIIRDPEAKDVLGTLLQSGGMGCWGTMSEFYGPHGTPNGHNFRVFESGIDAEAILKFYSKPW